MYRWAFILSVALLVHLQASARQGSWNTSFVLRGNYTSSAKIFFNPDAATEQQRSQYLRVEDMTGAGAELRLQLSDENIFFTLSVDYISKTLNDPQYVSIGGSLQRVPGAEGLTFIPVEVALNTYIPVSTEDFRMTMGGGIGMYYAVRSLSVLGVGTQVVNSPVGYGIHVNTGFEYRIRDGISVRAALTFRDPEITNESKFEQETATFNGSPVTIRQSSFRSRIQVDGLTVSAGVLIDLF